MNIMCYSGLFITKHLFSTKKNRYISLKEMFELGIFGFARTEQFVKAGIKNVSNSKEELEDFATESLEDLNGKQIFSTEDTKLQDLFWKIIFDNQKNLKYKPLKIKISPSFLRKNKYLLN